VLKDTTGQYLWQPGLQAGDPSQLLGRPLYTNPDVPAVGTAATSLVFGDVARAYTTPLNASITIQRLNELYAATGQVGFRGYVRIGGDVTLKDAFVVGKNHA
jgi:HK97 family phage major capsid protein